MSELSNPNARVYVAGHRGLVGSALMRRLGAMHGNLITRTHEELDLTDQRAVREFFDRERPEYVFLAAAKVGGILANETYPGEFIRENLAIQDNVIHESWRHGVKRLLFLGSSCIYPRDAPQPIKESYLLSGPLEQTNRAYALAKIAGIEMCWSYNRQYGTQYICVMPTNLYGPGDNYDLNTSHVLAALIRKFHEAKIVGKTEVEAWGSGKPRREFLHSDDLADACVLLMGLSSAGFHDLLSSVVEPPLVNVGWGRDLSISELAEMIREVVGFHGAIVWDRSKPDGTAQKLLMTDKMQRLGWKPRIALRQGVIDTYREFAEIRSSLASS